MTFDGPHESKRASHWAIYGRVQEIVPPSATHVAEMSTEPSKKRPALVVAMLTGDDVILCQITSKNVADSYAVAITNADFTSGHLPQSSNIRPNRLFTADSNIILYRAGVLSSAKMEEVIKENGVFEQDDRTSARKST